MNFYTNCNEKFYLFLQLIQDCHMNSELSQYEALPCWQNLEYVDCIASTKVGYEKLIWSWGTSSEDLESTSWLLLLSGPLWSRVVVLRVK